MLSEAFRLKGTKIEKIEKKQKKEKKEKEDDKEKKELRVSFFSSVFTIYSGDISQIELLCLSK